MQVNLQFMPYLHSGMKGLCPYKSQGIARRGHIADSHPMSQTTPIPNSASPVWLWVIYFSSAVLSTLTERSAKSLPALKTVSMRVVSAGGPGAGPEIPCRCLQPSLAHPEALNTPRVPCHPPLPQPHVHPPPSGQVSPEPGSEGSGSPAPTPASLCSPLPSPLLQIPISCLTDLRCSSKKEG